MRGRPGWHLSSPSAVVTGLGSSPLLVKFHREKPEPLINHNGSGAEMRQLQMPRFSFLNVQITYIH